MNSNSNYKIILKNAGKANARLVAVSKTKPADAILALYETGQRIFGENRVQEMLKKHELLPKDIEWHMIGHLQRNKVKYIAPFVSMIHGVDQAKLLQEINKQAAKNHRIIDCLMQVHIAKEDTKFGFSNRELIDYLDSGSWKALQNIRICGLMGMATNTDNKEQIRSEFNSLYQLFQLLKQNYFQSNQAFCERSMGMSGDYKIALESGSTLIRIGSAIFGTRD